MRKDNLEEPLQLLREKVLQSEKERLDGAKTISISEAREILRERAVSPKMQAFLDLEKKRLQVPTDFNYEQELEVSRDLKYGSIS